MNSELAIFIITVFGSIWLLILSIKLAEFKEQKRLHLRNSFCVNRIKPITILVLSLVLGFLISWTQRFNKGDNLYATQWLVSRNVDDQGQDEDLYIKSVGPLVVPTNRSLGLTVGTRQDVVLQNVTVSTTNNEWKYVILDSSYKPTEVSSSSGTDKDGHTFYNSSIPERDYSFGFTLPTSLHSTTNLSLVITLTGAHVLAGDPIPDKYHTSTLGWSTRNAWMRFHVTFGNSLSEPKFWHKWFIVIPLTCILLLIIIIKLAYRPFGMHFILADLMGVSTGIALGLIWLPNSGGPWITLPASIQLLIQSCFMLLFSSLIMFFILEVKYLKSLKSTK